MVVMALVTTVMTGPLLALGYPSWMVRRDLAQAERAALGAEEEAYRVLVVAPATVAVPEPGTVGGSEVDRSPVAADLTALATDLVGTRRPAEVVLSRLLPYPTSAVEVGSGLSGELAGMTVALGELARLAEPVRAGGLRVPVFARYTADQRADLAIQLDAVGPDLVLAVDEPAVDGTTVTWIRVTVVPPAGWRLVLVRATGAAGEAALRVGAQLAVARSAELVVDAGSRPERRVVAAVRELAESGVRARIGAVPVGAGPVHSQLAETDPAATGFGATGDPEPLVVATDGSAHLLVRSPRTDTRDEPREWVRQLVAPEVAAPQGVGGAGAV